MVGQRFLWAMVLYAAGFISSYLVHRAEQYEMEQREEVQNEAQQ
jgi:hypothetical protein